MQTHHKQSQNTVIKGKYLELISHTTANFSLYVKSSCKETKRKRPIANPLQNVKTDSPIEKGTQIFKKYILKTDFIIRELEIKFIQTPIFS